MAAAGMDPSSIGEVRTNVASGKSGSVHDPASELTVTAAVIGGDAGDIDAEPGVGHRRPLDRQGPVEDRRAADGFEVGQPAHEVLDHPIPGK